MHQILNKLLSIAVSDPDEEVREIMLGSLSRNFDAYLKNKSSLQCLILALNDSNDKVQRKAIIILKRLIFSNASDVVPALQNSLYRILRIVNMKTHDNEKDIIQNLKLLKCFLTNASFLLKNQEDLIFRFLLKSLQNQKTTQSVSAEIFSTLSCLVIVTRKATVKYFDPLMQITLDSFTDLAFTAKRVEAIRCLSNIIRSSGYEIVMQPGDLHLLQVSEFNRLHLFPLPSRSKPGGKKRAH
jgi:FKBP12-rapamycin complex-associated protein